MVQWKAFFFIIGCLWLSFESVSAGTGGVISIEDAVQRALKSNHNYLNSLTDIDIAQLDYDDARHVYKTRIASSLSTDARSGSDLGSTCSLYMTKQNPSGSSYNAGLYSSTFGDSSLSELRLTYSIPFFRNPLDASKIQLLQAEMNLKRTVRIRQIFAEELADQVIAAYLKAAMATRHSALLREKLELTQMLFRQQQIRRETGDVSMLDVNRHRLLVLDAEQACHTAAFKLWKDESNLRQLMGMGSDEALIIDHTVAITWDRSLLDIPLSELEAHALSNRVELIALADEVTMAGNKLAAGKQGVLPPFTIDLQYSLVGEGDSLDQSFELDDHRIGVGISLNTDLDHSEEARNLRKLALLLKARKKDYEQLRRTVVISVRQAYRSADHAEKQLLMAKEGADFIELQIRQSEILHGKGRLSELELLESLYQKTDADFKVLTAELACLMANQALSRVCGYIRERWNL